MTAVIILGLVWAAAQPASEGSFALFASIIYLGVPLAVISNLSTGPMLDRVSPRHLKNFTQGINSACYSLANGTYFLQVRAMLGALCAHSIPLSRKIHSLLSNHIRHCLGYKRLPDNALHACRYPGIGISGQSSIDLQSTLAQRFNQETKRRCVRRHWMDRWDWECNSK